MLATHATDASQDQWRHQVVAFLALSSLNGITFSDMQTLVSEHSCLKTFLKTSTPESLSDWLPAGQVVSDDNWQAFLIDLWATGLARARSLSKQGVQLIFKAQERFPAALAVIDDAPLWLFAQGNINLLNKPTIGIVGARKCSDDGVSLTRMVVSSLAGIHVSTISGLADGIDEHAHRESIHYGIPTIAVIATGIHKNYPAHSNILRADILKHGGIIISEYLPDMSASPAQFVRRNRIQAAMATALIPVEWAIKSGTSHTVQYAYSYSTPILNVYLQGTYNRRPEIAFSETQRSSVSFELPADEKAFKTSIRNFL